MLKIALWILVLFFGLPIIGVLVLRHSVSNSYTQLTPQFGHVDSSLNGKPESYQIEGIDEVQNSSVKPGNFKLGFRSLAKFGDIDAYRLIRFSTVINPRSLLKENESLPEKEFLDVFVEARGIKYGQEECKRLSEILASKCIVKGSHGNSDAFGNYKMTFALGFVQKGEFGQVGAGGQVTYQEISHTFKTPPRRIDEWGVEAEDERVILYKKVKEQCDLLRESQGNCAISRIKISTYRINRSKGKEATSGTVLYSLLYSDGEVKKIPDAKIE